MPWIATELDEGWDVPADDDFMDSDESDNCCEAPSIGIDGTCLNCGQN
jgi:hypothetical protein